MTKKTISIRLNDADSKFLESIMIKLNTDSPSVAIRYSIKMIAEMPDMLKNILKNSGNGDDSEFPVPSLQKVDDDIKFDTEGNPI